MGSSAERTLQILMVDDDATNLQVLTNCLKPMGYRLLQASNGQRALSVAENAQPDLILLDVNMPGMNGYDTCRELKKRPALADVPVLFLSANKDAQDKVKGFEAGGLDYIDKPFNYDELLARVKTHLELKLAREKLHLQNNEIESLLHVLSHDLMNPVAAMSGFVHLASLLETYKDPETRDLWENLQIAITQQEAIIEHVREMRALETGKKQIALSPVRLVDVMQVAQTIFRKRLADKKITLNVTLPDENLCVQAEDVSLTHNVVNNILSNAIKFSFRGGAIEMEAQAQNGQVLLVIQDHGMGIPQALLGHLFRADKPTSRQGTDNEMGTGFGMPLVKKYMDLYGAQINVLSHTQEESPQAHGTRVELVFRRAEAM